MPRGHWIYVATLGLAICGAGPLPDGKAQNRQANSENSATEQRAPAAPPLVEHGGAPRPDQGCDRGQDKRDSDLCAQWKAADAAHDAARAAETQTLIGWLGLVLGLVTMTAAIFAALYARRAAFATEETVELTKDASSYEWRPWINISVASVQIVLKEGGFDVYCRVRFQNTGRVVARDIITNAKIVIAGSSFQSVEVDGMYAAWRNEKPRHPISLIPDDYREVRAATLVGDETFEWSQLGYVGCLVVAQAKYLTPEGRECWSEQSFSIGHKGGHAFVRDGFLMKSQIRKKNAALIVSKFRSGLMT